MLMTTTGGAPARSSSARSRRPAAGQGKYARGRESAVLDHHPQRVPDILRELLEERPRPQRSGVPPQERDIAQGAAGGPPGLFFRQPIGLALVRVLRKMEGQFL